MLLKVLLLPILIIAANTERSQIPKVYSFYVYEKTFIDPVEGPSKCGCDPTQTITLSLKKDFSFILRDSYEDSFSASSTEKSGTWHLTSSDELQLNIQSTVKKVLLKSHKVKINALGNLVDVVNKPTKEYSYAPDTLKLQFSGLKLIFETDKTLLQNSKLLKFNKRHLKKIYGDK